MCGKKLGEIHKKMVDESMRYVIAIRHKGREISFVPQQKSTIKLRCDNKKCRTLYCFTAEGIDKIIQNNDD